MRLPNTVVVYRGPWWVVDDVALGIMVACSTLSRLKITGWILEGRTLLGNRGGGLSGSSFLVGSRTMHPRLPPCTEGRLRLRCLTVFRVGCILSLMRFARPGIDCSTFLTP